MKLRSIISILALIIEGIVKKTDISIGWTEYEPGEDPGTERTELIRAAINASVNAYAPYSGFRVGAALRLENGKIISGCNVENAAFPSGVCAERNAIAAASAAMPGVSPVAIAIAASGSDGLTGEPVPPCGNCRQVIAEEEYRNGKEIEIILHGKNKTIVIRGIDNLLPLKFNTKNLNPGSP